MGFNARVELWCSEDFSNPRLRHLLPVRVPVTRTSTRISTAAPAVTITALCCPVVHLTIEITSSQPSLPHSNPYCTLDFLHSDGNCYQFLYGTLRI